MGFNVIPEQDFRVLYFVQNSCNDVILDAFAEITESYPSPIIQKSINRQFVTKKRLDCYVFILFINKF